MNVGKTLFAQVTEYVPWKTEDFWPHHRPPVGDAGGRIRCKEPESGKTRVFLTSNTSLPPLTIAANLDLTARSCQVSDVASTGNRGSERIFRRDAAFTVRVHGPHAITLGYNTSQRNAHYPDIADTRQTVKTLSLLYTYFFGESKSGAVEWRAADEL